MKLRSIHLGVVLAAFTLAAAPALAQGPKEGGSPSGGGGERAGGGGAGNSGNSGGGGSVAVSSGGGGGGSVSSVGGSGGTFSTRTGSAATAANLSFGDRSVRMAAPQRRAEFAAFASSASADGQARPRTASGSGNGGERAVPRGTSSSGSSGSGSSSGDANTGARTRVAPPANATAGENNSSGAREVPTWSRPRGDRPATGTAVARTGPPPDRDGNGTRGRYYDPYYYDGYGYGGYGYGGYGYGLGYGYGYYPYTFGMGYGLYSGLGWNPYYGDPFDPSYGGYGGYSSGVYNTREQGNLKLKVKPRNAKVYVDGYFVGPVDEFDGAFQKLALNGGRHKVEIRAEGFETAEFDVLITPDQTVTFQGELKRIQ